jgi:hypothetical protein
MDEFFLEHLQQFVQEDFYEVNSRPYQKLTVWALTGLYEYAESPKLRTAARIVLDYLAAKYSVSSKSGRRSVPFRRQPQYRTNPDLVTIDPEVLRFFLYAGNLDALDELPNDARIDIWPLVFESLARYQVPDTILDIVLSDEKPGRTFWQGFHHSAWEVYAGSPNFFISAGGRWVNGVDLFSGDLSVWGVPTVLIPAREGVSRDSLVQILGSRHERQRNNLCVAPGFACGLNLKIPSSIPATCMSKPSVQSNWTFFDFTSNSCPLPWGFYLAVYQAPCDGLRCRYHAKNWGFFEASEPKGRSFSDFRATVLAQNPQITKAESGDITTYTNSDGVKIDFIANPWGQSHWGLVRYGKHEVSLDDSGWPLVWGTYLRAAGEGRVQFKNPYRGTELDLDYREAFNPAWSEK